MNAYEKFAETFGIESTAVRVLNRTDSLKNDWEHVHKARHFKIVLRREYRKATFYFSQGSAHTQNPTTADLLECLKSDSDAIGQTFEGWAGEMGYDEDSRKAERIFKARVANAIKLQNVLGAEVYQALHDLQEED